MLFAVVVKGLIRRAVFSCEAAVFTDILKISVFGSADIRYIGKETGIFPVYRASAASFLPFGFISRQNPCEILSILYIGTNR